MNRIDEIVKLEIRRFKSGDNILIRSGAGADPSIHS